MGEGSAQALEVVIVMLLHIHANHQDAVMVAFVEDHLLEDMEEAMEAQAIMVPTVIVTHRQDLPQLKSIGTKRPFSLSMERLITKGP